ncbi:flavin reductase [Leucobacter allii]|uniref:flavin reductase n=1 Tax=Leucobacter allii TaxID=2932247 RepID=UPI001FD000A7|nr:flavin reductase [Leucobacter allii]UOR01530.1 flavin reductase [Leucobacter allii]
MTSTIDESTFREVLGRYPTGVSAITARAAAGEPLGMVVGTFSSVSLDPPLVAFMPTRSSSSYARLRECDSFCVNVLSAAQEDICRAFAVKGARDKFAGVEHRDSPLGNPVLQGCAAWIDCTVERIVEAGDHDIVIGRVHDLGDGSGALPMLFLGGGYGGFSPHSRIIPADTDVMQQLRLADVARQPVQEFADRLRMECAIVALVEDAIVRIASAGTADSTSRLPRVGLRLPFEAPMGAPLVAWASSEVQERWVRRADRNADDAEVAAYLAALETVRERGWTLSLRTTAFEEIDAVIESQADSDDRRARLTGMHEVLNGPEAFAPDIDLEGDGVYRVRNVSVPVFSGSGAVMYLSAFGFEERTPAARIREVATDLSRVAKRVSEAVGRSWSDQEEGS